MRYTVFDTPVIKQFFTALAWAGLKLRGWKLEGSAPQESKYVLVAAPHTSNWDFLLLVSMAFVLNLKVYWMGKHSIFKPPFAGLVKWFGGVPVVRSKNNNLVEQMVGHFNKAERMVLVIPPEGTRGNTRYWKTGFYRIAEQAGVPIGLSYLDYSKKTGGIGSELLKPSGDLAADQQILADFYRDVQGCYPEHACPPRFKELETPQD